jgi:hypothetical protein
VLVASTLAVPDGLRHAMLSDVIDLVADTPQVDSALVVPTGYDTGTAPIWPGTPIVEVPAVPSVATALQAVAAATTDAAAVAVVVADVPDLPTLLIGKLFSALAGPAFAALAVSPAEGGGLIAAAAAVPLAGWVEAATTTFDDPDVLAELRRTAPSRGLSVGPGWHRIRELGDTARLDPDLEGWEATRSYLN